ncbi:MAG: 3-deoxy-D-manno-octulosonic acid transferase, partial [Veillonella sp.]|nr:3-deoxy-D-manno-octulosonic acid transferase [Veillonella sp.]
IPVMMVNGRISDRSMKRYRYISAFTKEMLSSIERFCMQSSFDADHISRLGADVKEITVTGNMKYDQTYATVTDEEKQMLLDEFGFGHNHPIIVAGSTHKGEEDAVFETFKQVLEEYPQARLLIAPREIYRGHDVKALAKKYGLSAICRSDMIEPVHGAIPVVVLDTIGELGRLYSLGDIIFVGGSLVKTGGHNILEPAAHGKPILVGPHMFNFKEIFNLLNSRNACVQVKNQSALTDMVLHLCKHPELAEEMGRNCLNIIRENRGATRRNTKELRQLFESHHIIP